MFFAPPAVFCGVFATFGETSLLLFLVKSEPVGGLVPNMDQMKAWEKVGRQSGLIKALKPSLNSENSVYIQELEFLKKEILHMYLEFCSKEFRKI